MPRAGPLRPPPGGPPGRSPAPPDSRFPRGGRATLPDRGTDLATARLSIFVTTPCTDPAVLPSPERTVAFSQLYQRHRTFVRRVLRRVRVPPAQIDDAEQDVFVAVFRHLDRFEGRSSIRTWLFRITVRVGVRYCQRAARLGAPLSHEPLAGAVFDPELRTTHRDALRLIERCLDRLDDDKWMVFVLSDIDGQTGQTIADTLGLPLNTVYSRLRRARREFRRELNRRHDGSRLWAFAWWPRWSRAPVHAVAANGTVGALLWIVLLLAIATGLAVGLGSREPAPSRGESSASHGALDSHSAKLVTKDHHGPTWSPQTARVAGRVMTDDRQTVANAHVCLFANITSTHTLSPRVPRCMWTDSLGVFRFESVAPGHLALFASATGLAFIDPTNPSPPLRGGESRDGVELMMTRGAVAISGTIRDANGGGIASAFVTASSGDFVAARSGGATTAADDNGNFTVWVHPGPVKLWAIASGYASNGVRRSAPAEQVAIDLVPESSVAGHVRDRSGEPVAHAEVELVVETLGSATADLEQHNLWTTSDDQGRYEIGHARPGRYRVLASHLDGHASSQAVALGYGEAVSDIDLVLHDTVSLRGRVVWRETNEPCASGGVWLHDGERFEAAATRDDGTVTFTAIDDGTYDVEAWCVGTRLQGEFEPVTIAGNDTAGLTWAVESGFAIRGYIVDAQGQAVTGVDIETGDGHRSATTQTDSDHRGQFELAGLTPGNYELRVADGRRGLFMSVHVSVDDRDVDNVVITTPALGQLRGHVLAPSGPVASVLVHATTPASFTVSAMTDPHGAFVIPELATGRYALTVETPHGTKLGPAVPCTVELASSGADLQLDINPPSGSATGTVRDGTGSPLVDVYVRAQPLGEAAGLATKEHWHAADPVFTDQDGRFRIEQLVPNAAYALVVERNGGASARQAPVLAGQDVEVVLDESASISGTLSLAATPSPSTAWVGLYDADEQLLRHATPLLEGERWTWTWTDLVPGSYRVRAHARGQSGESTRLAISAGEHLAGVAIALQPTASVRGQVLDADAHTPVAAAYVWIVRGEYTGAVLAGPYTRTDASGRYRFVDIGPGDYTLVVTHHGLETPREPVYARIRVNAGHPLDVEPLLSTRVKPRRVQAGQRN